MTEAEWLACDDPKPMLESLRDKASDRKLRLFAVACCRRLSGLVSDSLADDAVRIAERHAEGFAAGDELGRAAAAVSATLDGFDFNTAPLSAHAALALARKATHPDAWRAARGILVNATWEVATAAFRAAGGSDAAQDRAEKAENAAQADLLRDIFGNPFRPATLDPAWRTPTAVALAGQMYESRDFGAMPILADALQDAGCDSDEVLDHCRGPGPHVRGCWVVDLVLGKA